MADHKAQTDGVKKVSLTSSIHVVSWTRPLAVPGGLVGIEIYTQFVGNGADMEIELSDKKGKKHGKFKESISGNRFWAEIRVPAAAREGLIAEVKLPKHGLQVKSAPLMLLPPIEITNLQWDRKEARRGDTVKMSADVKTVPDDTDAEVQVLEFDSDGAHDPITKFATKVKNNKVELLWEYEYKDDTDDIPTEAELKQQGNHYAAPQYFFRVIVYGLSADSGLLLFKDWFEIVLVDELESPVPNEKYVLTLPDGQQRTGTLDGQGHATEKDIPPGKIDVTFPNLGQRGQTTGTQPPH